MKLANDLKETCNNLQKELLEAAMERGADDTRFVIKMFLKLQESCERERLSYPPLPYSTLLQRVLQKERLPFRQRLRLMEYLIK